MSTWKCTIRIWLSNLTDKLWSSYWFELKDAIAGDGQAGLGVKMEIVMDQDRMYTWRL